MFVPQTAFMTDGSIRDQIHYPLQAIGPMDSTELVRLSEILQILDLKFEKIDRPLPVKRYEQFSPGEVQRIALARVMFHRPRLVVLDEATSAIAEEIEEHFYEYIQQHAITPVTVAHR